MQTAKISTEKGDMKVEFFGQDAPLAVVKGRPDAASTSFWNSDD